MPLILGLKAAREGNDSVETVAWSWHLRRPVHDGGSADVYIPTLGGTASEAPKKVLLFLKLETRCPPNREVGIHRFHEHRSTSRQGCATCRRSSLGYGPELASCHLEPRAGPRQPQNSALYQLLEAYYQDVKAMWEDRFEKKHGFWRGFVDAAVAGYLDCGVAEAGFARLKCDACGSERLRRLPAFAARPKRTGRLRRGPAEVLTEADAAFLKDELLENVGHSSKDAQTLFHAPARASG